MLPYKTWRSVLWFLLTWLVTIGLVLSLATSYWLVGPDDSAGNPTHVGFIQDCGVTVSNDSETGQVTRLFLCNGIRTSCDSIMLLVVMAFLGVGVLSILILTILTLVYCFCDQLTACGRSFHTLAGIWQATSCVLTMVGVFLFPVLWDSEFITAVCVDSGVFQLGQCTPSYSLYLAIVCSIAGYFVAGFSTALDTKSFRVTEFDSMESLDTYKQGV